MTINSGHISVFSIINLLNLSSFQQSCPWPSLTEYRLIISFGCQGSLNEKTTTHSSRLNINFSIISTCKVNNKVFIKKIDYKFVGLLNCNICN